MRWSVASGAVALSLRCALALDVSSNNKDSLQSAASKTIWGMMTYYHGNETGEIPGAFPSKWWEGSALMMALTQYWFYTGDTTYNDQLSTGMQWQGGENGDYMPRNYSRFLGNDDQMFWGTAAMTAAELSYPDNPSGFSWLSLAQGVYNTQIKRWDTTGCGGGLRWQIYPYQAGYTMKNSISNGGLFQLAARLYRYTEDTQYLDWANKVWDWSVSSPLVNNKTWNVADSTNMPSCDDQGDQQWTYNYGAYLAGAAYLYNSTSGSDADRWKDVVDGLLGVMLKNFVEDGILKEASCEPIDNCNLNEILFKGVTSTWLSLTAMIVPETAKKILPLLEKSAAAVGKTCGTGNSCGIKWSTQESDGTSGMEQQVSASDVILASMSQFGNTKPPVTAKTGGNSSSNPNAGEKEDETPRERPMTTGDRVGAAFLTIIVLGTWSGSLVWLGWS